MTTRLSVAKMRQSEAHQCPGCQRWVGWALAYCVDCRWTDGRNVKGGNYAWTNYVDDRGRRR